MAVALDLEPLLGPRVLERGLELRGDELLRVRIAVRHELLVPRSRMRDLEQPVVQAHFRRVRMHRAQPMDVPFHLDRLRARSTRFRERGTRDRKSTRLNSSHQIISYAVFC